MDENEFQTWIKNEAGRIYQFCSSSPPKMDWEKTQEYIADQLRKAYEIGKQHASKNR